MHHLPAWDLGGREHEFGNTAKLGLGSAYAMFARINKFVWLNCELTIHAHDVAYTGSPKKEMSVVTEGVCIQYSLLILN
jgi:hypothetical protein